MQTISLRTDTSFWWILLLVFLSAGVTYFLYGKNRTKWTRAQQPVLGSLRFLGVFLSLLLLLGPYLKYTVSEIEKPIIGIAIDNSESVAALSGDTLLLKNRIDKLASKLEKGGIRVRTYTLNTRDSLSFNHHKSNLTGLLNKVTHDMEGRNWAATVLFSDGIFNEGNAPEYTSLFQPLYAVGIGDTVPPRDVSISRVSYNRISYKGNEVPVRIEVSNKGCDGEKVRIVLRNGNKILDERGVTLSGGFNEVLFHLEAGEEGLKRLNASISLLENEFSSENNRSDFFIEVIDNKQQVLVASQSPHPDISAIRRVLDNTGNYETEVYIPAVSTKKPAKEYDVIIYHGEPPRLTDQEKNNPGLWHILNEGSSLRNFSRKEPFLKIEKRNNRPDMVSASHNQAFGKFSLPSSDNIINDWPPVSVPFGDYSLSGPADVLLYQKIGTLTTKKPLFVFYDDGSSKRAVLTGQNIWKWKMQENAITGSTTIFDEMVTKTVQYLSVKSDKKRFRFRSTVSKFPETESPAFRTEVYNSIYERIYGSNIQLVVKNDQKDEFRYEFSDSETRNTFRIPSLKPGLYTYRASTTIGQERLEDAGSFYVEKANREYLNLTANHDALRNSAIKNGGFFIHESESDELADLLLKNKFKSRARSSDSVSQLIEIPWVLLLILLLFSTEWFLRKYWGRY